MPIKQNLLLVNLMSADEVDECCKMLSCSEETLRKCISYTGCDIVSIESFLNKNREWIEQSPKNKKN